MLKERWTLLILKSKRVAVCRGVIVLPILVSATAPCVKRTGAAASVARRRRERLAREGETYDLAGVTRTQQAEPLSVREYMEKAYLKYV